MTLFLLTFFVVYGSVHVYAFLRIRTSLHLHVGAGIVLAIFMLAMILAPLVVRILEGRGFESAAIIGSHIGYYWMGLMFFFFCLSITLDLYRCVVYGAEWILKKDFTLLLPSPLYTLLIPLAVAAAVFGYAFFEARDVRTEKITIASEKIPAGSVPLRIVQISDVHVGLIIRDSRLNRVLEKVKEARPDLLVSTGDLLDGQVDQIEVFAKKFVEINPRYGKYAIMGNHEYFAGFAPAREFIRSAGFTLLRGEGKEVAGGLINLIGFDDPTGKAFGLYRAISDEYVRNNFSDRKFTIFLKHRPVVNDFPNGFDLQLSGHTHKGQIFPFNFIVQALFPMDGGFYKIRNAFLYVSRGSGTWGPPLRFFSPPEVTVIELVHKDN